MQRGKVICDAFNRQNRTTGISKITGNHPHPQQPDRHYGIRHSAGGVSCNGAFVKSKIAQDAHAGMDVYVLRPYIEQPLSERRRARRNFRASNDPKVTVIRSCER